MQVKVVRLLLEAGADVNRPNEDGESPLCVAVSEGHVEVVRALLEAGADVNRARTKDGQPALYAAACSNQNSYTPLYNVLRVTLWGVESTLAVIGTRGPVYTLSPLRGVKSTLAIIGTRGPVKRIRGGTNERLGSDTTSDAGGGGEVADGRRGGCQLDHRHRGDALARRLIPRARGG
eukprot:9480226-Pyramimonas_sp.AAC.3